MSNGITASGFLVNRALENLARTLHRGPSELGEQRLRREEGALRRKRVERLAPIEEWQGRQAQGKLDRDKASLTFGYLVRDNPNVAELMLWSRKPKEKTLLDKTADMLNADHVVSDRGTIFIDKNTGKPISVGEAYKNWPQMKALFLSHIGIDRKIRSMDEDLENKKMMDPLTRILEQNKDKPFVKRILNPSEYPSMGLGKGQSGTHLMSWGQVGDKYVVFPTILHEGGKLKKYSPDEAFKQTMKTGNYIEFNTPEEAEQFSKEYKRYWEYDAEKKRLTDLKADPSRKIQAAQKLIGMSQPFAHYPDIQANITRLENKISGWQGQIAKTAETKAGREFTATQNRLARENALTIAKMRVGATGKGKTPKADVQEVGAPTPEGKTGQYMQKQEKIDGKWVDVGEPYRKFAPKAGGKAEDDLRFQNALKTVKTAISTMKDKTQSDVFAALVAKMATNDPLTIQESTQLKDMTQKLGPSVQKAIQEIEKYWEVEPEEETEQFDNQLDAFKNKWGLE